MPRIGNISVAALRRWGAAAAALCLWLAPASHAQASLVFGNGQARECFTATDTGATSPASIRICTSALEDETLSRTDRAATFVNRGVLAMRAGEYATALADYDRALTLEPELGEAHLNRGAALIFLDRNAEARTALDRAIALNVADLKAAHYNRALAYENLGDVTSAWRDFLKASELAPNWDLPKQQLERFQVVRR
jgi:tetratricopeptide (TPR) repeat protein